MPTGQARFGATILGISNNNPGVVTVDNIPPLSQGEMIRIAAVADNQAGVRSLNGNYTIASIMGNQISLDVDTSLFSVYISGGFLTQLNQQFLYPSLNYGVYVWTNEAVNNSGYIPVGDTIPIGDNELYD